MLGWINQSIRAFITDTFGADKWDEVLAAAGMVPNQDWVSSCPYSDKITYDLVVTAAGLLGVQVNDALEAYGLYFVQHVADQGYTKLLNVLGSNVAEFLQNLNNLHWHLSYCWPDMIAPSFRCEEVTPESLLLHYYSSRPGLWPIVVGVLKGMSTAFFKLQLQIELLHSRERGDCDHEVFRLRYPYQEQLRNYGDFTAAAQASIYTMPTQEFYQLHPFHLVLDSSMQLLQWGRAVEQVVPDMQVGQHIRKYFKLKHPSYIGLDYQQVVLNTNSAFVLQARASLVQLKGQMLPTSITPPGAAAPMPVLLYLASPRIKNLAEMQESGVFLSDIALHDMTSDYILLAEQRHAEADLKEKYERLTLELKAANDKLARTTARLEEEKARAEALLYRMSGLIACFPGPGDSKHSPQQQQQQAAALTEFVQHAAQLTSNSSFASASSSSHGKHSAALDRIEAVRQELARANISSGELTQVQCLELLGEGTYGKVYKGLWKGSIVAVKTIVLPAAMSGQEKREKMAIMEAAISSALSHPNIMQTYTYDIRPIKDNSMSQPLMVMNSNVASAAKHGMADSVPEAAATMTTANGSNVHSFEVRLVLEYCDRGSLREALDLGAFKLPDGSVNYPAVLDTGIEIATAVLHLHTKNVLHSDLKARNIMLKSAGSEGRGVTSKVADFGLAVKMDHMETHLSNAFQGTMTHMAPEIMIKGHISKAADVYALGMLLWELYTARHVFRGIPRALLGHQITLLNKRPEFPAEAPEGYVKLVQQCWDPMPSSRPTLEVVLDRLQELRAELRCKTQALAQYDIATLLAAKNNKSGAQGKGSRRQDGLQGSKAAAATVGVAPPAAAGPSRQKGVVRTASDVGPNRVGQASQAAEMAQQHSREQQELVHGEDAASPVKSNTLLLSPNQSKSLSRVGAASGSLPQVEQQYSSALPSSKPLQGVQAGWEGNSCADTADLKKLDAAGDAADGEYEPYYEGERSFYLEHSASTNDGEFGMYGEMMVMNTMETETEEECMQPLREQQQQHASSVNPEQRHVAAGSCPYRQP